ncbi:MAG: LysR family transcriptional regulator [Gammaproteobacteria bacterium]|nr:LysR family transcriptional regulator [Gammaproteobacteria bacterium]MBV8306325.1 LysR family transcriptional regulator [Gammaproteobacteria bacterium]
MDRLPSIDSLYVFAVAARHLSFTAAAAELHRTQSAVSHRVKALEAEIGARLFERSARGLELTAAGRALARQVDQAISDISRTLAELGRAAQPRNLRITLLPSVASRWLMPRLPRFLEQHPDIEVQVIADARVLDLRAERIDLAIRFGHGRYRRHVATLLMGDRVLPVCAPQLIGGRAAIVTIDALLELPLLHDSGAEGDGSLSDWHSWLDQLGRPAAPHRAGQRFSHAGLAIEAAVLGLGVTLARLSLVTDYLASGALICPLALSTATAFSYHLVALPEVAGLPEVMLFSNWLRTEARHTAAVVEQIGHEEERLRVTLNLPAASVCRN